MSMRLNASSMSMSRYPVCSTATETSNSCSKQRTIKLVNTDDFALPGKLKRATVR
ncbi:hypothetical protein SHOU24_96 [Vibrio phage SHOU24]|uniref:hypothetical protein n=1 Tax=Vibrio phage SHOU24 TaxID=1414739 RepID=UPI0003ED2447|nr:hypothetical protein SHOU24_96 [Vibrio phage SHOU24]AHI61293.1 hypothetical protein SHOU24_96 [Vibrio phage SHOU24]